MKIALLLSGFLRTFNYNNLKEKLINNDNNVDIFIYISKDEYNIDKYLNKKINIDEIIEKLNPKKIIYENEIDVPKKFKYINTYRQWYKIYLLNNEKLKYEYDNSFKYDIVIKSRPDIYLFSKINDYVF